MRWAVAHGLGQNVSALDMKTPSHQTKQNTNKIKQTLHVVTPRQTVSKLNQG